MKSTPETKALAKEAGIKSWHMKSEEKLQAELAELGAINEPVVEEAVIEPVESTPIEVEEVVEESGAEELATEVAEEQSLTLPSEPEPNIMIFSIKCVGHKSPYYKYKDLL